MKVLEKIKALSKREKILLGILSFLIFELFIYSLLISPFLRKLNNIKISNHDLESQINIKNKAYKKALEQEDKNKELENQSPSLSFNNLDEENLKKFSMQDLVVTGSSQGDNGNSLDFKAQKNSLNSVKRFNDFFIFKEMQISKELEDEYRFRALLADNHTSNLPTIVDSGQEKGNLKEIYYKNKAKQDKVEDQNKIDRTKNIKSLVKDAKKSESAKKKIEKIEIEESLKENLNKDIVKNLQAPKIYKTDELISDFKFLELDINKFATYTDPENELSLINLEDSLIVDYEVSEKSDDKYLLIFFNQVIDVKNFKILLELPYNFSGEIGYLDTYRKAFDIDQQAQNDILIEIDEIKNLKGLYYKANGDKASGYFIVKSIEAEI